MNKTNKLTVPDLISIGVFTALYFVLVTIATFASVAIFPGFNNVVFFLLSKHGRGSIE